MPRKKDGLEVSKTVDVREGSRGYAIASLDVGDSYVENRVIKCGDVSSESMIEARKDLNSTFASTIQRLKKQGVDVMTSTARGMTDAGDVVVSLVITRTG